MTAANGAASLHMWAVVSLLVWGFLVFVLGSYSLCLIYFLKHNESSYIKTTSSEFQRKFEL